jgi:hypothetical protein
MKIAVKLIQCAYTRDISNLQNFSKEIFSKNEDGKHISYREIQRCLPSHLDQNSADKNVSLVYVEYYYAIIFI